MSPSGHTPPGTEHNGSGARPSAPGGPTAPSGPTSRTPLEARRRRTPSPNRRFGSSAAPASTSGPARRAGLHLATRSLVVAGLPGAVAAHVAETDADSRILPDLARRAMWERQLNTDFPSSLLAEVEACQTATDGPGVRDLRDLLFFSIDNDDSLDLDQLSYAERLPDAGIRVLVAIADVDALVPQGSGIDRHAAVNTTSIYTSGGVFPMLPRRLSEDLTSLNEGQDRLAVVTEMVIGQDGEVESSDVYRALVRNHAKLAYNSVAAWLDGRGPMPARMAETEGVAENVRVHDEAAQRLKARRRRNGSLTLESREARARQEAGRLVDIEVHQQNRATDIIENLMVATNGVTSRTLQDRGLPTLQRIVREPKNWEKLVDLAAERGTRLPKKPNPVSLERFLEGQRQADPLRFPDLSLEVVKLLGRGEYVMEAPGRRPIGHFGLAVREYSHSTAPNRRYPDLLSQRLIKAALAGCPSPYTTRQLQRLAEHCTEQEAKASKVERQMEKSLAALFLLDHIGQTFQALVSGANPRGTWVRILKPPVEGFLQNGQAFRIGQELTVRLVSANVEKGFIDFAPVGG